MYQISNEKFGLFVNKLRKEKNFTQKELAEKLYVSDKAVSKWERGISMPNVVLLVPIAEVLGVTVTELLQGKRIDAQSSLSDLPARAAGGWRKKYWIFVYIVCLLISVAEIIVLLLSGIPLSQMRENVLLVTSLMLIFGGCFCFWVKELLPVYYDSNKINYVSQGIFRIHITGLSFHNGNWPYICIVFKIWTLVTAVTYPLVSIMAIHLAGVQVWNGIKNILAWTVIIGMIVSIYIVGKKYE